MPVNEIIQSIRKKQPESSIKKFENSYNLLKKNTSDLTFIDKKNVIRKALERALFAAKENACIEYTCAVMFFDLGKRDKNIYKEIKSTLGEDIERVVKSYNYAEQHLGPEKKYLLDHSERIALDLAYAKLDSAAICTALLHEVPNNTQITIEDIEKLFGSEIGTLSRNFQKIRAIKTTNNQQYISHLREMTVAMAADLRVIIIKMCSNIDRMLNPTVESEEKLMNIALESREIFAPLADLLGIWQLRWRLEDYSFKILEPQEYEKISRRFHVDEKKNRNKYIQKTISLLQNAAKENKIVCSIDGRFKHFYSIHAKMKAKKKSFDDICDVFALRVIVEKVDDCYRMLGLIHNLWRPKNRRIKDYIAAPKSNKYRSLHTTVFGLNGRATEFQIRTREMHEEANYGITAHWHYKNPRKKIPPWIQELLLKQQEYTSDEEFINKFKSDVLGDRIYVYSPKGDVISLPANSTPIDFAYHIHSEIGHKCSEALVNDIPVPLNYNLATNDIVQIILDRNQRGPKANWLDFVKTNAARNHIEDYLKRKPVERSFRL